MFDGRRGLWLEFQFNKLQEMTRLSGTKGCFFLTASSACRLSRRVEDKRMTKKWLERKIKVKKRVKIKEVDRKKAQTENRKTGEICEKEKNRQMTNLYLHE